MGISGSVSSNSSKWIDLTDGGQTTLHSHVGAASAPGGSFTANIGSDYTYGISGVKFVSSQKISGGTIIGTWNGDQITSSYISDYIASSSAKTQFAGSSNIRFRFVASSTANEKFYPSSVGRDLSLDYHGHSSNTSLHSFTVANYITSANAITRFTDSSNVRLRFQASSLARQSYLHSANSALHTFNIANYITSTNAITRFADSSNYSSHKGDSTIHFTLASIGDDFYPSGIGAGLSGSYASHRQDATIHFTKSSIDDDYQGSSQAIAKFADSSNIRYRFVASSVSLARYNQYIGFSSNKSLYLASSSFKRNGWVSASWHNSSLVWDKDLVAWKAMKSGGGTGDLTRATADGLYYPSSLGKALMNFSSNKTLYAGSSQVSSRFAPSTLTDTRLDSLFNFSSNKSLYLASSSFKRNVFNSALWHNSGIVWDNSLSAWKAMKSGGGTGDLTQAIADIRYKASSGIWTFASSQKISGGSIKVNSLGGPVGTIWTEMTDGGDISDTYHTHSQYGAGTSPGGGDHYVQYNNEGAFGGDSALTWNDVTNTLRISGAISGAYISAGNIKGTTITIGDVSNTEFGYLNGVTSAIQTQLDSKPTSSNAIARFADSSNINRTLLNTISSNLDTRIDSLFNFSSNKSLYPASSLVNRVLINSISSNLDIRIDSIFSYSSNAKNLYADSSNVRYRFQASSLARQSYLHSANQSIHSFNVVNYITSTNSINRFYPSTTGKATSGSVAKLWLWSSNKSWYANSSNIRSRFVASSVSLERYNQYIGHSGNTFAHITTTFSSNVRSLINWSSNKSWYANSANVRFRFPGSSTAISRYRQSSAAGPTHWNYVSSSKISANTYLGNLMVIKGTTSSPGYLSSNRISANSLYGYTISCAVFKGPSVGGTGGGIENVVEDTTPQLGGDLDANSKGIYGLPWISGTKLRFGQGVFGNGIEHFDLGDYNLRVSGSSYLSGNTYFAASQISGLSDPLYPSSAVNKNYSDTTFAHSSNIHYRFQASSVSHGIYNHSANKSLHDTFTLNIGMVRLSANQSIKVGGFQMASSQNLYVWKACCADSGGRSAGNLWIQVCSGQRGSLNAGPYTNIYKTSCNRIQKGNPLATYGTSKDGTNVVVRMMYSAQGWKFIGSGQRWGTSFMELSTY